jgi:hypothetical protein
MSSAPPNEEMQPRPAGAADPQGGEAEGHPHNFEVQKEVHRQIRNDPDYDDWEYGTEPLPHEAWVARRSASRGSAG